MKNEKNFEGILITWRFTTFLTMHVVLMLLLCVLAILSVVELLRVVQNGSAAWINQIRSEYRSLFLIFVAALFLTIIVTKGLLQQRKWAYYGLLVEIVALESIIIYWLFSVSWNEPTNLGLVIFVVGGFDSAVAIIRALRSSEFNSIS
ncbi:MAG: hypothetical protein KatS3mg057_1273 [Herpetosiphonaceae bacterium]|nr:MAG: hypothetical protein KatS3mg057_1273 [Herpetosiphonaceae bacterium]